MKLKYLVLSLIAIISLVRCSDGFLDKQPLDQISAATFWNTRQDADMALAACYAGLDRRYPHPWGDDNFGLGEWGAGQMSWMTPTWDCLTDNASDNWGDGFGFKEASLGQIEPEIEESFVTYAAFYIRYQAIATCNIFIQNIDNVEEMNEQEISEYKAEVMFLRAFLYFSLAELYGGVPLVTEPIPVEESLLPKNTRSEVIAQVKADLDFAISYLPDDPYEGHAVKGSASALKARVLLYEEDWPGAAALAQQVMTSGGGFTLSDSYQSNFFADEQEGNPEIIFSIKYLYPTNAHFMDAHHAQWQNIAPLQNFVDAFECTDGLPTDQSAVFDPANPYDNRDPRLRMTVAVYGDPDPYSDNGIFDENDRPSDITTPFLYQKWLTPSYGWDNYGDSEQDIVLLRYADVLLMYAEAQNEAVGPDASVYSAVNEVRARVGMPDLVAGLSQSEMRDHIRLERRVELSFEGTRYFDLKRWGIYLELNNQITEPGQELKRDVQEHQLIWPFPQAEIDINSNLLQNPGY